MLKIKSGPPTSTAAALTTWSILPNVKAYSTNLFKDSLSAISHGIPYASTPASFNSAKAASNLFWFLPPINTGPKTLNAFAVASPIPLVPPVTTCKFFVCDIIFSPFS